MAGNRNKVVLQKLQEHKPKVRPADLATALHVSRAAASYMLSGARGIPEWHFETIAHLLGVSVPELLTPNDPVRHTSDLQGKEQEDQTHAIVVARLQTQYGQLYAKLSALSADILNLLDDHAAAAHFAVQGSTRKRSKTGRAAR